ncbi:hypothetical protein MHBO_001227 [Bonamia ostreae]|uniref:C2H2-type domain-containing protein n=1 Tax=Bonamia ostreae TaxID=126728 RepID=A0ABV2AI71_9EUKA
MSEQLLPSRADTYEVKTERIRRELRKRTTFKKGKDANSLWRRRWIPIKTIESSFSALTWVRADNDFSNSDSDLDEAISSRNEADSKGTAFSFFRSARRRCEARRRNKDPKKAAKEVPLRELVKGPLGSRLLPPGWVPRKKPSRRAAGDKNKGKTEHICDVCKKVYGDFNSLKKHKRIHGEKKHACQVKGCPKAFSEASKLKRHMMVHTKEKPFQCPYPSCRRDFGLNYNLRKHIQVLKIKIANPHGRTFGLFERRLRENVYGPECVEAARQIFPYKKLNLQILFSVFLEYLNRARFNFNKTKIFLPKSNFFI